MADESMKSPKTLINLSALISLLLAAGPASAEEEIAAYLGAAHVAVGTNWDVGNDENLWLVNGCRKDMVYPSAGFRYFSDGIWGIEASLFLWGQKGGWLEKRSPGGTVYSMNSSFPHFWAFAVRAGVPLRLYGGERDSVFSFLIIPDVGFAHGAGKEESMGSTGTGLSVSYAGSRLDVGVRAGGELRLGPVALQLTIGAYLLWETRGTKFTEGDGWDFRTNDVWFAGSIKGDVRDITNAALLYYFEL